MGDRNAPWTASRPRWPRTRRSTPWTGDRLVGSALLRRLEEDLAGIQLVSLFCAAELAPLYERAGFRRTSQVVLHRRSPAAGQPNGRR